MAVFHGSKHDDNLTGTSGDDIFDLYKGGNDTASGGDGSDSFNMGASLNADDRLDGGTGNDVVVLRGDYSTNVALDDRTIQNIETLKLGKGFDYNLTTADGNVAAGETLNVNARALGAADSLVFDGSQETDGRFVVYGGGGDDAITGGARGDRFNLSTGGNDVAHGGDGNDVFVLGGALTAADRIDGGAGNDTLVLDGDYHGGATFGALTMTGIETLKLSGGDQMAITLDDANVAAGAVLTVDAGAATGIVAVSGVAELDGAFHFIAGQASSNFTGGAQNDVFDMLQGQTSLAQGSGGDDTINFGTNWNSDAEVNGGTGSDTLTFTGDYANLQIASSKVAAVETVEFLGGRSYNGVSFTGDIAGGSTLVINAGSAGDLSVDLGGATSAAYAIAGSGGNDAFKFGANFSASDTVDGAAGNDTLELHGDYSGGLNFGATTMTNVEALKLDDGFGYKLTVDDATVASGATLTVDASALTGTHALVFDGSAETDGVFNVHGGAGGDTFKFGGHFSTSDTIDGGAGIDTVSLTANGNFTFTGTTLTNVENLKVDSNDSIAIATNDGNIASGATMTVDFSASSFSGGHYAFDGGAETDGHFAIVGPTTAGSFSATGGALSDSFTLGDDGTSDNTIHGNGGDDTLTLTSLGVGANYDGGTGNDTLSLTGGGTPSMSSYTLTSVEALKLDDNTWNVTTTNGNVADGATLTVDASALGTGHTLTFDGSAETNGAFTVVGGAGDDVATGGSGNDGFNFTQGGNDTGHGGAGNDTFSFGGAFTAADTVDGGANTDTISLNGDYSAGLTFGAGTLTSIENIVLAAGHSYSLTTSDANVAGAATLTLNASALGAGDALTFDGSAETNGFFTVIDGAGNDVVTGGAQSDTFTSRGGNDTFNGGGGNDTFNLAGTLTATDSIDGGAGNDILNLSGDYTAGLTLGAATILGVETIALAAGHGYNLTTNDANVASGATLAVDVSALGASDALIFNGLAETNGFFAIAGGAGSDSFTIGARAVLTGSTIDGGAGSDTLTLNGNYSTVFTLGANTIRNIETIVFDAVNSNYILTSNDANVAGGQTLTLDGTALTRALTWDASAETDGFFHFEGGAGSDVFTVGSATVLAGSTFDGGSAGNNFLILNGDFSAGFDFAADTISHVQNLTLDRNHSYDLTVADANVAAGGSLFVNGLALLATDALRFDGSAETDGHFTLEGGNGSDTLIGGAGNDTLWGYVGADTMTGGGGADTFFYTFAVSSGVAESTSTHYDTITDIDFSMDKIDPPSANGHVTEVDPAILGGTLSTASFDSDLANAVNATDLAVNGAVLFTADAGTLASHTFLVVDENGIAGYQAGVDLVIDVTGYSGTLTTGSFI